MEMYVISGRLEDRNRIKFKGNIETSSKKIRFSLKENRDSRFSMMDLEG